MEFTVDLKGYGFDKEVTLDDSIKNTRKVLRYQAKMFKNFDIEESTDASAYQEAQIKGIDCVLDFLKEMLNLSTAQVKTLEDKSYQDIASMAGEICTTILRTDEDDEDSEEDEDTKK